MEPIKEPEQIELYDFVMVRLANWKYRWPQVADGSGVPIGTIKRIAGRETTNPGVQTCQALANWFRTQPEFPQQAEAKHSP